MSDWSLNREIVFKQVGPFFLVADPTIGAFSLLREEDLLLFAMFYYSDDKLAKLKSLFELGGLSEAASSTKAQACLARMESDGWLRTHFPERRDTPLEKIYLTITANCNLSCPYCYQGLAPKERAVMPIHQAEQYLNKIRHINPHCQMVITGGEPFLHADIFAMMQLISDKGFPFTILTNGTRLTAGVAEQLKAYDNLTYVQVSLDGMSRSVHRLTRADSYEKTIRGIRLLIEFELPFSLAPTIHEGNLHEIYDIAHYAIANGGGFTPNNLRKFPHDANGTLSLCNGSLYRVIREINTRLVRDFGAKNLEQIRARNRMDFNPNRCRNDKSVCGIAYSIVDINWNGDVYPCNLLRRDEFKLGNLQVCDFEDIFKKAETLGIRTRSCDIPKCRKCELVSICGGGCRAGAFYNYGSFLREDDLCDVLYRSNLDWRLMQKGAVDERP